MTSAVEEYEKLTAHFATLPGIEAGQMFGKPCLKLNGKAFLAQHKDVVVFKLAGAPHREAMAVNGAALWDPSGKGRPMKEWVALPVGKADDFGTFAAAARQYSAESGKLG